MASLAQSSCIQAKRYVGSHQLPAAATAANYRPIQRDTSETSDGLITAAAAAVSMLLLAAAASCCYLLVFASFQDTLLQLLQASCLCFLTGGAAASCCKLFVFASFQEASKSGKIGEGEGSGGIREGGGGGEGASIGTGVLGEGGGGGEGSGRIGGDLMIAGWLITPSTFLATMTLLLDWAGKSS